MKVDETALEFGSVQTQQQAEQLEHIKTRNLLLTKTLQQAGRGKSSYRKLQVHILVPTLGVRTPGGLRTTNRKGEKHLSETDL